MAFTGEKTFSVNVLKSGEAVSGDRYNGYIYEKRGGPSLGLYITSDSQPTMIATHDNARPYDP